MNSIFRFVQRFAEIDKKWGVNKSGRGGVKIEMVGGSLKVVGGSPFLGKW